MTDAALLPVESIEDQIELGADPAQVATADGVRRRRRISCRRRLDVHLAARAGSGVA